MEGTSDYVKPMLAWGTFGGSLVLVGVIALNFLKLLYQNWNRY